MQQRTRNIIGKKNRKMRDPDKREGAFRLGGAEQSQRKRNSLGKATTRKKKGEGKEGKPRGERSKSKKP